MRLKYMFIGVMVCINLLTTSLYGQPQRLAVIGALKGAAQTICIDYFADIPSQTDVLKKIIPIAGNESGAGRLSFRGTGKTNSATIVGAKSENVLGNSFIVGTEKASSEISEHYRAFLEDRINAYKQGTQTELAHEILQQEVWEYDALNHLGYMNHGNAPFKDYTDALQSFKRDFGSSSGDNLLSIASGIKEIVKANSITPKDYKFLYITKNQTTGDFFVFDGLKKPIYQGSDKRGLVKILTNVKNDDNLHIDLSGFASENSEKAFLTDLRTQFRLQRNISVQTTRFDPIIFSQHLQHRVDPNPLNGKIKEVRFGDDNLFQGSVAIQSMIPSGGQEVFKLEALALSADRAVVERFVSIVKSRISYSYHKIVLANSISSIKKYVVSSTGISSSQLHVFLRSEISLSIITKANINKQFFIAIK